MRVAALVAAVAAIALTWALASSARPRWDTCYAPCVVKFHQRANEDQFDFNYSGRGNGAVEVWRNRTP